MNFRNASFFGLLLFSFVISLPAQQLSAREEADYLGPAKLVRTLTVKYSFTNGKPKAEKKRLDSVESYDESGNLIETFEYDENGVVNWHEKSIFENGRVTGYQTVSGLEDTPDVHRYKFDAAGNIVEEDRYNEDGKLASQLRYIFDDQNREVQMISESFFPG